MNQQMGDVHLSVFLSKNKNKLLTKMLPVKGNVFSELPQTLTPMSMIFKNNVKSRICTPRGCWQLTSYIVTAVRRGYMNNLKCNGRFPLRVLIPNVPRRYKNSNISSNLRIFREIWKE